MMYAATKIQVFPYSLLIIGPGAHADIQAVSLQVTLSHPPGSRLQLLYARLANTFPAEEHHCPLTGTKLGLYRGTCV